MLPFAKKALANLFKKPSTVRFPEVEVAAQPAYRGRLVYDPEKCVNCGMCIKVCSPGAITRTVEEVEGGEKITYDINLTSCTFCGTCQDFCGTKAISLSDDYHMVADYYHAPSFEEGEEALIVKGTVFKKAPVKKAPPVAPKAEVKAAVADAKADVKEAVKEAKAEVKEAVKEAVADAKADVKAAAAAAAAPVVEAVKEAAADVKEAVEKAAAPQPRDDGKPVQDPAKCVYCTLCARNCPMEALTVDRKAKTWELNEEACIGCGTCATACPKDAIIL